MEKEEQQQTKSLVVKVDSKDSWDLLTSQANSQNNPVFVHFTASWCVPSVAMNSSFEELAVKHKNLLFLLVDVDEVKGVASELDIKAMPTFVLMNDGNEIDRVVGANPGEIGKRLDSSLHLILATVVE